MIRIGQEDFFIEPLDQYRTGGGEEEKEEGGRKHIVYRSSAIIKKPPAVNQSSGDFIRGEKTETHTRRFTLSNKFLSDPDL